MSSSFVGRYSNPSNTNSVGQALYAMYPTAGHFPPTPFSDSRGKAKRREVAGWQESDYLDYADFDNAIKEDEPIPYALCQWLVRQAHDNIDDPFTDSQWEEWYEYALEHCPRFAKEQPGCW
jgi:hypothetical protein